MLTEDELVAFEKRYGIRLPAAYRMFLSSIGNGGVGPAYGLEPLNDTIFYDLDDKRDDLLIDPSKEFTFTEAWNMDFEDMNEDKYERIRDGEYSDPKWINGVLQIANFGCGIFYELVVNGQEHGHMWVDDRGSNQGIYPVQHPVTGERVNFIDWYELWLGKSLTEVNA